MTNQEKLQKYIDEGHDIMNTTELAQNGVHHNTLAEFVKQGKLSKVSYGIYLTPDTFEDKMLILQIRRPALIYSHETALCLHDLTDRDPVNYSVTVPTGYNTKVLSQEGLYVHSIQRDLYSTGITEVVDMFNHKINVYNVERTICDILRDRSQIDISIITDALKRYVKRRDKNLNLLMEYAELFKVTKVLRNYLEVLL